MCRAQEARGFGLRRRLSSERGTGVTGMLPASAGIAGAFHGACAAVLDRGARVGGGQGRAQEEDETEQQMGEESARVGASGVAARRPLARLRTGPSSALRGKGRLRERDRGRGDGLARAFGAWSLGEADERGGGEALGFGAGVGAADADEGADGEGCGVGGEEPGALIGEGLVGGEGLGGGGLIEEAFEGDRGETGLLEHVPEGTCRVEESGDGLGRIHAPVLRGRPSGMA